jgi:hypothetical protein
LYALESRVRPYTNIGSHAKPLESTPRISMA